MRLDELAPSDSVFISFSGGRTSGFMTWWLLNNRPQFRYVILFANTGLEHPRTLEFVHECDQQLGFGSVWLEADVRPEPGVGTTHRQVTFESASRRGEPYEEMIRKYGIPNKAFPQCTRELKLRPMHSYLRSIGLRPSAVPTAIGIRADETRRVREQKNILYPLVDDCPMEKADILDWWAQQAFDLGIEEFEGNCLGCFKKSERKLFAQLDKDASVFDFHDRMERLYSRVGPQKGERFFFRGNRSTQQLIQAHTLVRRADDTGVFRRDRPDENGGCSESCELYETG